MDDSGFSSYPDMVVPPHTWGLSRSKVHNLSPLAERLGPGHLIWRSVFEDNGAIQEIRRRNRNPLNNANHLRWRPEKFKVI
jgi:hypothetical protein